MVTTQNAPQTYTREFGGLTDAAAAVASYLVANADLNILDARAVAHALLGAMILYSASRDVFFQAATNLAMTALYVGRGHLWPTAHSGEIAIVADNGANVSVRRSENSKGITVTFTALQTFDGRSRTPGATN